MDVYGWCIPLKEIVFPHLAGEIQGFGKRKERFEQFQIHHIHDPDALAGKGREYDFSIYNIVKYFTLVMENNPTCLDSLFVPQECILHMTHVGKMVRDNRHMFLHKGAYHRYLGYALSQMHKMTSKERTEGSKRKALRDQYGFDVKFGMHVCRLMDECEQLLTLGDIDMRRANEFLKSIRRGEVSELEIKRWAGDKEKLLEKCYAESSLPYSPDENKIKQLLLDCLEHHYGSLEKAIVNPDKATTLLREIKEKIERSGI
jgi:predicted nucleotidyltransferase